MDVVITPFTAVDVAAFEHLGPLAQFEDVAVPVLKRFCKGHGLPFEGTRRFGVFVTDPNTTSPQANRYDYCVEFSGALRERDEMAKKVIPSLRCARFRHWGSTNALYAPIDTVWSSWLPDHGETATGAWCGRSGEFPLFFEYIDHGTDGPTGDDAITDVYIPLRAPLG